MDELQSAYQRPAEAVVTFTEGRPQEGDNELVLAAKQADALAGMVPTGGFAAITPDDDADLTTPTRAIYVGGAGDVVVKSADNVTVTFSAVPAGTTLPIVTSRVMSTGTTATNLLAL